MLFIISTWSCRLVVTRASHVTQSVYALAYNSDWQFPRFPCPSDARSVRSCAMSSRTICRRSPLSYTCHWTMLRDLLAAYLLHHWNDATNHRLMYASVQAEDEWWFAAAASRHGKQHQFGAECIRKQQLSAMDPRIGITLGNCSQHHSIDTGNGT